jgi:hypothetical protein
MTASVIDHRVSELLQKTSAGPVYCVLNGSLGVTIFQFSHTGRRKQTNPYNTFKGAKPDMTIIAPEELPFNARNKRHHAATWPFTRSG